MEIFKAKDFDRFPLVRRIFIDNKILEQKEKDVMTKGSAWKDAIDHLTIEMGNQKQGVPPKLATRRAA